MANTNIISPSKLDRFNQCPLKFRKDEYEARDEASVIQQMGIDKHRLLEKIFTGKEITPEETVVGEELLKDIINDLGLFTGADVEIKAEESFLIDFDDCSLHGIKDLVNRVDDRVLVIDWKTGKKFFRKEEVENSLQGKIYAVSEFKTRPETQLVFFRLAMTHYGRVIGVQYDRETLPELEMEIKLAVDYFRSCYELKKFPAKPGSHCGYCKHIATCPHNILTNNKELIGDVDSDKLFADGVKQVQVTEEYLNQLKDMVDSYAKDRLKDDEKGKVEDIVINIKKTIKESVSTSKKSKEIIDKYKDKLGIKIDTSIKRFRELPEEDINKLKELGVINQSTSEKLSYKVISGKGE